MQTSESNDGTTMLCDSFLESGEITAWIDAESTHWAELMETDRHIWYMYPPRYAYKSLDIYIYTRLGKRQETTSFERGAMQHMSYSK